MVRTRSSSPESGGRDRAKRKRSLSGSPRRKSPSKKSGRPDPRDSIIPFKDFLMRQADDVTPEEAQKAYNRYKRETAARSAKVFFDKHSQEDWLRERYDYSHDFVMIRRDRAAQTKLRTHNFEVFQKLRSEGLVMFPYFENTSPLGYFIIPAIPPALSRTTIAEVVNTLEGLCHFTLGSPDETFSRTGYFFFTDKAKASAALSSANWTPLNLKTTPKLPDHPLNLIRAPRPFSVNIRAAQDLQQCLKLIEAFDKRYGITHTLFKNEPSLPICLAYLREVHLYDYFRCKQYASLDEMVEKSTTLDTDWDDDYDVRNWEAKVDTACEKAIVEAAKEDPPEEAPWSSQLTALTNAFNEENVQKKSDTKYKCMQCAKLFLGPQFVIKHLQTKHGALVDALKTKACHGLYLENYMADENRPFETPSVSKNARAPDSSRRRERKESRKDDRSRSRSRNRDKSPRRKRDKSEKPEKKEGSSETNGEKKEKDGESKLDDKDANRREKDKDRSRSQDKDRSRDRGRSKEGDKDREKERYNDRASRVGARSQRGPRRGGGPRPGGAPAEEKDALGNRSIVSYVEVAYADPDKPTPEEEAALSLITSSSQASKSSDALDLDYGFGSFDFSSALSTTSA